MTSSLLDVKEEFLQNKLSFKKERFKLTFACYALQYTPNCRTVKHFRIYSAVALINSQSYSDRLLYVQRVMQTPHIVAYK